jgi:CRP/FNR family transcriptional regulator, dissimilatory nitrate respiration regulator
MMLETRHSIPEILSRQSLFRGLETHELARLAKGTYEYRISKHEALFHKGDVPGGMHLVIAGQIKLFLPAANGAEMIVHMAGPGETFGEEAALPHKPSPVAAEANRDSLLLVIDKPALIETMRRNCDFANAMLSRMCERMCILIDNMETCLQLNSAQRVVQYLTQHAPDEADSYDLELDANKQTIASQLNLAPETFSRVLNRLSKDGYIHVKGRNIRLRNLTSLRNYAG